MLIKTAHPYPIKSSEITPEAIYRDRRRFLLQMGMATASIALSGCGPSDDSSAPSNVALASLKAERKLAMAGGENVTAYEDITHYNDLTAL